MLKTKNKKSLITIEILIKLTIGILVLLIVIFFVVDNFGKGREETSDHITSSRDFDSDGIVDYFDRCPCDYGPKEDDGCDPSHLGGYTDADKNDCDARRKGTST